MNANTTTKRTVCESKDINFVRAFLRARGFECGNVGGWRRGTEVAGIYFSSTKEGHLWYTVIDE